MSNIINIAKHEFIKNGYIPLFSECKNINSKLLAKTTDGFLIMTRLNDLIKGKTPLIFHKNNPYTIENINHWLILNNKPYILTSKKYIKIKDKYEFKTYEGYKFLSTWDNIYRGSNSPCLFSKYNPFTIENIKIWIKLNNYPYKILSTVFENSSSKLLFYCNKHGKFNISWDHVNYGCGCKKCGIEKNSQNNHYKWKGGETPLYKYLRSKINDWKYKSLKNCDFKCVITGKRATNKYKVHHLLSFHTILQEILDKYNIPRSKKINEFDPEELRIIEDDFLSIHNKLLGVCLHPEIHKLYHHVYFYGHNTPEQFEEFKIRYNSREFDEYIKQQNKSA